MMANQFEFSLRVEFFDDLSKSDQPLLTSGYAGAMILDGVTSVCPPRVGEEIHWINRWMPMTTGRISRVEHHLGGFAPPPEWDGTEASPSLIAVIEAERPDDDEMDQAVADFEAQGWTWRPPSDRKVREEARPD